MNDDFNTPVLISYLFEAVRIINSANDDKIKLTQNDIDLLNSLYQNFVFDIMGLRTETENSKSNNVLKQVMNLVLDIRAKAKSEKNFLLSDDIRNKLTDAGVTVKDGKDGASWNI